MENIAGTTPVHSINKGVYSKGSILLSSFIGGPFVAGWLMGENYKTLGKNNLAKKAKIIGIVSTMVVIALGFLIEKVAPNSNFSIAIPVYLIAIDIFTRYQKKDIEEYLKNGGKKRRMWPLVCIIFTTIILSLFVFSLFAESQIASIEKYNNNGKLAIEMIEQKKYTEAIALLSQNVTDNPKDAESNKFIGIAKLSMGDTKGAIDNFTLALTNKHNNINDRSCYYYRGQAYLTEGKLQMAHDDFVAAVKAEKATVDDVPDEELYFKESAASLKFNNYSQALQELNAVININPDYESATIIRAALQAGLNNKEAACKDAQVGRANSTDPEFNKKTQSIKDELLRACK